MRKAFNFMDLEICRQRALPDVKSLGIPDHIGDRRGPGISQKHRMLGFMTAGGGNFNIVPGADIGDDIGPIILI